MVLIQNQSAATSAAKSNIRFEANVPIEIKTDRQMDNKMQVQVLREELFTLGVTFEDVKKNSRVWLHLHLVRFFYCIFTVTYWQH